MEKKNYIESYVIQLQILEHSKEKKNKICKIYIHNPGRNLKLSAHQPTSAIDNQTNFFFLLSLKKIGMENPLSSTIWIWYHTCKSCVLQHGWLGFAISKKKKIKKQKKNYQQNTLFSFHIYLSIFLTVAMLVFECMLGHYFKMPRTAYKNTWDKG